MILENRKPKNLVVFGTRPEAIKMAPLVKVLEECKEMDVRVCVTGQHREMLDQVLEFFNIKPDYDLSVMKANQTLFSLTASIILNLEDVLKDYNPDFVYVHGDTTTCMATSLAAFYHGAKVCHVEAGLRTFNKRNPFPEELNRLIASKVSDYHFAPTLQAKDNLINEGIPESQVFVTGNTVIDALFMSVDKLEVFKSKEIDDLSRIINLNKRIILVTGHRRENHGDGIEQICDALKYIGEKHTDVEIVFPVHLNPNVKNVVFSKLKNISNIHLTTPLSYPSFMWVMKRCELILTDSGGIQEEAPSLGKYVLVMRETTERPEALTTGFVKLIGSKRQSIIDNCELILNRDISVDQNTEMINPYGDGRASKRIVEFINKIGLYN